MKEEQKLILEGFQTFKERVEIPINRITLLFGPNSSGKSAVYDGLILAEQLFASSAHDQKNYPDEYPRSRFSGLVEKGWRKIDKAKRKSAYAEKMVVGIQDTLYVNLYSIVKQAGLFLTDKKPIGKQFNGASIRLCCGFRSLLFYDDYKEEYDDDMGGFTEDFVVCRRDFEVIYDDELFAELIEFERISINISHRIFSGFSAIDEIKELCDQRPNIFSCANGLFSIIGEEIRIDGKKTFDVDSFLYSSREVGFSDKEVVTIRAIFSVYNQFMETALGNLFMSSRLVDASRNIPSERDLTFSLPGGVGSYGWEAPVLEEWGYTAPGKNEFLDIALSFAESLSGTTRNESAVPLSHEDINRYLSDYLFIDRGYQLDFEYLVVLKSAQFDSITREYESLYPNGYELVVRIFLRDENGVRLGFEDVGSGLGYVLPVLSALSSSSSTNLFIQQPELHLHPALQAKMGDVIIDASTNRSVVVETHSEHLLLRILRRIRQTTNKKIVDDHLSILADDVSVLYFDRGNDGSTKVKQLRVSSYGEFMDRWPSGFFEERDQELFDE